MEREVAGQLRRIVAGDRDATAWFYDRFAPRLFRRLRQRYAIPFDLDVEELLQDAFVYYLQNEARVLARYLERTAEPGPISLERYLWDLACGVASNQLRNRKTRRAALRAAGSEPRIERDPADRRIDRDTIERLESCLRRSRERIYLYYKLRYLDGLSPEEISRATGWSRRVTYRLRQQLNVAITDCAKQLEID